MLRPLILFMLLPLLYFLEIRAVVGIELFNLLVLPTYLSVIALLACYILFLRK